MSELNVYVSPGCWSCDEARQIVVEMQMQFPQVEITLLDGNADQWPDEVFAVPTYMLNGKVISLGNPSRQRLQEKLHAIKDR